MGSIQPRYDVKYFDPVAQLIFLLDAYRVDVYTELKWMGAMAKEGRFGHRFRIEWEEVEKLLTKMARVPKSIEYVLTLAKYQHTLRFVGNLVGTVVLLLFGIGIFFVFSQNKMLAQIFSGLLISIAPLLAGMIIVSFTGPILLARRIQRVLDKYRAENPERFERSKLQIKTIVQDLIDSLSYAVLNGKLASEKQDGVPATPLEAVDKAYRDFANALFRRSKREKQPDYSFGLFKIDYKGIKIIKRPSRFRKHYLVTFQGL